MGSISIILASLLTAYLGWRFYSKFLAEKVLCLDPDFKTPAHVINDGIDYVPTRPFVLWSHHFTLVAGAAPIGGPSIAVYWVWLPAVLWVLVGTVFFAGVHDTAALWASTR